MPHILRTLPTPSTRKPAPDTNMPVKNPVIGTDTNRITRHKKTGTGDCVKTPKNFSIQKIDLSKRSSFDFLGTGNGHTTSDFLDF
jgi:hypothetical protein